MKEENQYLPFAGVLPKSPKQPGSRKKRFSIFKIGLMKNHMR